MEKHCVLLVNKCLVGEIPLYFKDYFMLRTQSDSQLVFNKCTRSSIIDITLSKFRLDVAKESLYYHGASLLNGLPMNIKTLSPMDRFRAISARLFLEHFFSIQESYFFILYTFLNDILAVSF